jgi:hypothetical protein
MTQGEIEVVAEEIRTRSLHSSWDDLVGFWQSVIGNLERAYHASVQSMADFRQVSSADSNDMQTIVRDELATALRKLAGGRQMARWYSEAMGGVEARSAARRTSTGPSRWCSRTLVRP